MKIKRIRTLNNPNIYSHQPVLLMHLEIEAQDAKLLSKNPDFFGRLHDITTAEKEAAPMRSIRTAKNVLAEAVKNVARGLINQADLNPNGGVVRFSGDAGIYEIAVEFKSEEVARFLMKKAVEAVESALENKLFDLSDAVRQAEAIRTENEIEANTRIIIEAAEKRGIPWSYERADASIQLGYGRNLRRLRGATTDATSILAGDLIANAGACRSRLAKFSVFLPDVQQVSDETEAARAFESIGAPVVVKSTGGRQYTGFSRRVQNEPEIFEAFRLAAQISGEVTIEEVFEGKNYRVLVINHTMEAAVEHLTENGAAVYPPTFFPVTGKVHASIRNLCERAARIVGLDICEIDLIMPDISMPLPKRKAGIVRLFSNPDLQTFFFNGAENQRGAGDAIIEMLYPNGQTARIPVVAITGTNGKTTVTRLTAHVLRESGRNIGTTTTDGILFNGESIAAGDTTGPASARVVLDDRGIDIAVLETARGGIMRRGLGWDWAQIAVVTNITEDHIGQDGIESVADLVDVKSLIAERVIENGTLILNADDHESAALARRETVLKTEKRLVYFAMSEENPILKKQFEAGETAYFVRDKRIYEKRGAQETVIAETTLIPITMNGTADFQIQNAMAVCAVSRALGLTTDKIAAGLYGFRNVIHNPGRNNFYRVGKGFALVDYGHNPKAMEAICRMTARWTGKTMTGIVSFPGDRRDDVIEAAGRIAAAGFDRIIVKGDINLRGRASGEVAEMLCRIVLETGNQSECKIVLDAAQAFDDAIANIEEDEVVVFFYEKLAPVLATLKKYGATAADTF